MDSIWLTVAQFMGRTMGQTFDWLKATTIGGVSLWAIFILIILVKMLSRVMMRFMGIAKDYAFNSGFNNNKAKEPKIGTGNNIQNSEGKWVIICLISYPQT